MKAFVRVFRYIWPQWHRLVIIFVSVLLISIFYGLSFGTISPLLTVMMGSEGLHGWINRNISENRYGLSFYVPDSVELSDPNNPDVAYFLRVADVKRDSFADQAGLQKEDMIVGAGGSLINETTHKIPSRKLLWELATITDANSIAIQYRNPGQMEITTQELQCSKKPFYADYAQRLLRFVPQEQTRENKKNAVVFIIALMAVATVARCTARFYQDYTVGKVVHTSLVHLREDAFQHSLEVPVGFFDAEGSSDTVSRLVRDTDTIGNGIKFMLGKALREPIKALGLIGVAMLYNRSLTLIFLCAAPISLFILVKLGKKIRRATKRSLESWAIMLGKLKEAISAIQVVKVYNRQEYEYGIFHSINQKLLKQQFRIEKVDATTGPALEMLGMIAGSVGLIFGAQWVFGGTMQAPDFFALCFCLGAAADSVRRTSSFWNKIQQANTAAQRVYSIIDRKPEAESTVAFTLPPLKNKIEFRDVVFTYPGTDRAVLNHINLSVEAGHNVALVGPNGSGKTTLANLIPRFYDPDAGQILIDGKNIRDATLFSLRSQIGMVTQKAVTFNDTIAANIAYGKPGATREEIIAAARRSFAHEFIAPLPNGYDTVIGEQGAGLSGGQLQRIVIARAILKNPAILIFDEATSQIDADSEAKIHKAIAEIMQGRTSFIIAHRFSTVMTADVIVVMDDGQIIAQGQHDKLLQSCPLYQSLYETQLVKA